MDPNPYRTPNETGEQAWDARRISGYWIVVAYLMPLLMIIPFCNQAGWYGIGLSGTLQRAMQVIAFFIGLGCSYFGLFRGTFQQKIAVAPAALGYTGGVVGLLSSLLGKIWALACMPIGTALIAVTATMMFVGRRSYLLTGVGILSGLGGLVLAISFLPFSGDHEGVILTTNEYNQLYRFHMTLVGIFALLAVISGGAVGFFASYVAMTTPHESTGREN